MSASGSEKRARKFTLTTRTTEDEKRGIKARANAHGMTVAAYLREIGLDKPLPKKRGVSKEDGQKYALMLASLGVLMTELKKLEPRENDIRQCSAVQAMTTELHFLRDQCFKALNRTP